MTEMTPSDAQQAAWPWNAVIEADYEVVPPTFWQTVRIEALWLLRLLIGVIYAVSPFLLIVALLVLNGFLPR